jgi:hypothetical protein
MAWLDLHEIRYTQKVKFIGKTGFDHNFDIVIPKSRAEPERVLQAVNHPDKNAASNLVFGWLDTREARPSNSRAYAMLNDSERPVSAEVLGALSNYGLTPVAWSGREQVRAELAR